MAINIRKSRLLLRLARKVARASGYTLVKNRTPYAGYLNAEATVRSATDAGRTIYEQTELAGGQAGVTLRVLNEMRRGGCLRGTDRVLEIGPGSGRFLEPTLNEVQPSRYDIYEIADDWSGVLLEKFGSRIVRNYADGTTLGATPDDSCGLVHAHVVFVYLKPIHAFAYFAEMARVCSPDGYVVFDFYPSEDFDESTAAEWIAAEHDWAITLPRSHVVALFDKRGFRVRREFSVPSDHGSSRYLILAGPDAAGDS